MDIRILNYFITAAREESITKAAAKLHITQPTLSRQLMQLERELGVRLFNRGKYSVTLSEEGLIFRRRAQEIVDLAERARYELIKTDGDLAGEISVGCNESQSVNILAELINGFREQHPKVAFVIKSGSNIELREWLEQGTIDAGLFVEPMEAADYNYIRLGAKDVWGVLASDGSRIGRMGSVTAKELAGVPMITIMDEAIHSELACWAGEYASMMTPIAHYNLLHNAAALVRGTEHVAVCSKPGCRYDGVRFVSLIQSLNLVRLSHGKERSYSQSWKQLFLSIYEKSWNEAQTKNT